jgi:flagellar basal-body rod modification protein FlgD
VEGDGLEYAGSPVLLGYGLDESATRVTVKIFDEIGRLVRQMDLGAVDYGDRLVTWDGTDNSGLPVTPGPYTFNVHAVNAFEETMEVVPYTSGRVSAITLEDGTASLVVGGKLITQDKIKEIY